MRKKEKTTKKSTKEKGFTLSELLITLGLALLLLTLLVSVYILSSQSFKKSFDRSEIIQNSRVFIDRITREIRQTPEIVTVIPADASGGPPAELMFQDGHTSVPIKYIRYYLSGSNLKRQELGFYFTSDPTVYVKWNALDLGGNPPTQKILEDMQVGEYINSLSFYGVADLINLEAKFQKNNETVFLYTKLNGRNL